MKSIAIMSTVELNRRVLHYDLVKLKKNLSKINAEVVDELDDYFDVICEMARLDAEVFKSFFHRIIGGKK